MKPLRYIAKKSKLGLGNAGRKLNPLEKPIDKNDNTDSGAESVKVGYKITKKTYQTSKKAVHGVKVLYNAPAKTAKIAKTTVKIASSLVIHTAAFLISPVFWIIVILLLIVSTLVIPFVIILAGGAAAGTTSNKAYGTAAGSNQVITTAFPKAEEFYRIASEKKKDDFNSMIDSLYYSSDDVSHSDLVYMKCSHDGSEYLTSIAIDERKQRLKDKFSNSLSKAEAIALVYVYLEKQQNDANNTTAQIYEIEFTQQSFNDLLDKMISWTETKYSNQECPEKNCSIHREEISNPTYEELSYKVNMTANAHSEWGPISTLIETWNTINDGGAQAAYWDNNIGWRIDNWKIVYGNIVPYPVTISNGGNDFLQTIGNLYVGYLDQLNNTSPTITKTTTTCDRNHELHSIGLDIISKESVMNSWGFDEQYKQWVELTYQSFLKNPNIQS